MLLLSLPAGPACVGFGLAFQPCLDSRIIRIVVSLPFIDKVGKAGDKEPVSGNSHRAGDNRRLIQLPLESCSTEILGREEVPQPPVGGTGVPLPRAFVHGSFGFADPVDGLFCNHFVSGKKLVFQDGRVGHVFGLAAEAVDAVFVRAENTT